MTQSTYAEITPDQTLGPESSSFRVETNGAGIDTTLIEGGAVRGDALFHSFLRFDVDANQRVFFSPSSTITNIFSRVTGSTASEINGLLGVNGTANLFLFNPQGIVFGPNAALDLNGSFLATTADSFDWGNGLTFSAVAPNPAPSLLNVQVQPGLQYGQNNRSSLVSQADLQTRGPLELASQTLNLEGSISTTGNDVTLKGTDITLTDIDLFTRLEQGQIGKAGNVSIQAERLTVNGPSFISTEAFGEGDGGNIDVIASDRILLQSLVPDGGNAFQLRQRFDTSVYEAGNAGEIRLTAPTVILDNADLLSELRDGATGGAGNVFIDANNITMDTFADIETQSFGQGNGGDIVLKAQTIDILGTTELTTRLQSDGIGKAGDLTLEAGTIRMREESKLRTEGFGDGNGGRIELIGRDRIELIGEFPEGGSAFDFRVLIESSSTNTGNGGDIVITTPNLLLDNTDLVSNIRGEGGNAGNILITADLIKMDNFADLENQSFGEGNGGNVVLKGQDIQLLGNTEITTRLKENSEGNAGDILIEAQRLEMLERSRIQAETFGQGNAGNVTLNIPESIVLKGNSEIDVRNDRQKGQGDSGRITVTGGSMTLINAALWAQVLGRGKGNGISVDLTGDLFIDGQRIEEKTINGQKIAGRNGSSGVFTGARENAVSPDGEGAGNLFVKARNITMIGSNARIQTGTIGDAIGGEVKVVAEGDLILSKNARVLSSADAGAKQDARNMTIEARRIELRDQAIFESATRSNVDAGNITITAEEILMKNQGQIVSSTTEQGNAGSIDITATRSLDVLKDSVILSGVDGGTGNGGNIFITTGTLTMREGGRIEAQTEGNLPNLLADSLRGDSYEDVIQRSNPVAYWRLDENGGNRAIDSGSGNFDGTYEGGPVGSSSDAISGRAAQFDGDGPGGIIQVDPDIGLEKTTFFLEAWVKPDQEDAPREQVFFSATDPTATDRNGFYLINYNYGATNTKLDAGGIFVNDALPVDGQWHHVINQIKYDSNTGGVKITNYLDGRQIRGGAGGSLRLDEETIRIGGLRGPNDQAFKGLVDEVAIYKGDDLPINGVLPVEAHYIAGRLSRDPSFSVETPGAAIAGNINITADTIDIAGVSSTPIEELNTRARDFRGISSGIFSGSETQFSGQGGNINLDISGALNVDDAGAISALTASIAEAGTVDIQANTVNLTRGGQVLATSSRTGQAGDVRVTANQINVSGFDPNYQTRFDSVDNSDIRIDVNGPNSGIITANTLGNGGNIILSPSQLLVLRNQGLIRTDSGGDGGDITINNQNGFIVAVPDENSDITANASLGTGGNIDITTQGIFGIEFRQQQTPFSDLTASSEFGVNGTVNVDVLNIDPSQGLSELPTDVTDPSNRISRSCSRESISQNSFTQTGRGGLPVSPANPLRSSAGGSGWITVDGGQIANTADPIPSVRSQPTILSAASITEARNWSIQANGTVKLFAAHPLPIKALDCAVRQDNDERPAS